MRKLYTKFFTRLLGVCSILVLLSQQVAAQDLPLIDYKYILEQVKENLAQGEVIALRDAGLLLDKPYIRKDVLAVIQRHTLFTSREIEISETTTSKIFLAFFYEHQAQFKFHHLLQAFYITPLEDRSVPYSLGNAVNDESIDFTMRLQQHIQRLNQDIEAGDLESAYTQIQRIGELEMEEGYLFLLEVLEKQPFLRLRGNTNLYQVICQALAKYRSLTAAKAILRLAEDKILPKKFVDEQLVKLTNLKVDTFNLKALKTLLDTASSMEAVRQLGYDQQYGFKPYFFEHPVDFYGKIFLRCDSISWLQQNALDDLVETRHHRIFYYLSLKLYQSVLDHPRYNYTPDELSDKIQALIGARIRIHDSEQQLVLKPNWVKDKQGSLNFLIYWVTHHEDYEWDASRKQFINKTISLTLTNTYKNSLQRLTSSNDSVAWNAYLLLTEGKSEEIVALTDRYRPALYNHNKSLPPIESYYLEQLVLLTEFCKRNNIVYKPRENIAKSLDSLSMKLSPSMRYHLEKKLLDQLQINDLTSLEYYACLKASNLDFSYSMGWLLDRAYSRFWKDIASSESQLRIFLKKSYLFSRLGSAGICNLYLKKASPISDELYALLGVMEAKEFDLNIIAQIKQLRASRDKTSAWEIILTSDVAIHQLPEPPKEAYAEIAKAIQQSDDANVQIQLMNYLSRNPSLELVPHLIKLLKESVNQRQVVSLLETLYAYPNRVSYEKQKDYWLDLWQQDSINYQQWGQKLLQEKLTFLKTCKEITINDLNTAFQSPYLDAAGRVICLEAISKVKPTRNIRRLNLIQGISVEKELNYLEPIKLTYRDWIETLPLFKVDSPEKLLDFYKTKLADLRVKEQGWCYAKLFQQSWINSYLANGQSDKSLINPIKKVLNEYLDDKEVPEAEKDMAVIALAKIENAGKTLEEQLKLSFQIKVSNEARAAYQKELIAAITYTQISSALRDYSKLSPILNYNFLQADFGVPVFDLSDVTTRTDIISRHLTMNTGKFFAHYLREFGVKFEDDKQKIDFNAVYEMLEYDLCLPFSGSTLPRNFYSYGLIKLLEAELGFLIGFHPKLNCGDHHPCESLPKRTFSWMRYLEQQRLVIQSNQPRSFLYAAFTAL